MKTPWHLWAVGILGLLWNAMGAVDYYMTTTKNQAYMGNFTPEQLEFFYGFPSWSVAAWAVGVWLAVLGSLLLLMRKTLAIWAFLISFIGMVGSMIHSFGLANPSMLDVTGTGTLAFSAVIVFLAIAQIWYARHMKILGVLT